MQALRRFSHSWPARWAVLLATSSTASALSLANFQVITSNAISTACIIGYNSEIFGCTTDDFTGGNTCSSECVSGILRTASIINTFCDGEDVNPSTLLGITLAGNLIDKLCPGVRKTVTVTVQPTSTENGFTTVTNDRSTTTSTITTTTTSRDTTTTSQETTTSTSKTKETTSAIIPPDTTTTTARDTTSVPPPLTTGSTESGQEPPSSTATEDTQPAFTNNGSPFLDFRPDNNGGHLESSGLATLFLCILTAVLLTR